jgi:hypothetical protein
MRCHELGEVAICFLTDLIEPQQHEQLAALQDQKQFKCFFLDRSSVRFTGPAIARGLAFAVVAPYPTRSALDDARNVERLE